MMDLLASLSTKTLIGFDYLSGLDNFLFALLYFLLKIVAKVMAIGGFSSLNFLLFLGLPKGRGILDVLVKIEFSNLLKDLEAKLLFIFFILNVCSCSTVFITMPAGQIF